MTFLEANGYGRTYYDLFLRVEDGPIESPPQVKFNNNVVKITNNEMDRSWELMDPAILCIDLLHSNSYDAQGVIRSLALARLKVLIEDLKPEDQDAVVKFVSRKPNPCISIMYNEDNNTFTVGVFDVSE